MRTHIRERGKENGSNNKDAGNREKKVQEKLEKKSRQGYSTSWCGQLWAMGWRHRVGEKGRDGKIRGEVFKVGLKDG